jgi:hypothetical protein
MRLYPMTVWELGKDVLIFIHVNETPCEDVGRRSEVRIKLQRGNGQPESYTYGVLLRLWNVTSRTWPVKTFIMFGFQEKRAAVEAEGVFIGGWSIRKAIAPTRINGKIGTLPMHWPDDRPYIIPESSQDKAEHVSAIQDWDDAEERRLLRKIDLRVLLPCCIVYFFAYLDRANMGFAAVMQAGTPANIEEDLHLHGIQFNWAVSITYFMVTVLLLPSNLLMKTVSGKRYFPCVMIGFGVVVASISAVKNAAGLLTARFFLGIPESGVVPACIMYFSFWYKPSERAWRIGIFHAANSLASGVGGFLAIGIDNLNGKMGLESWRWLFVSRAVPWVVHTDKRQIIEGVMPIAMSVPVYFMLLTFPETSTALNERGISHPVSWCSPWPY